jgi:hypothetical protein
MLGRSLVVDARLVRLLRCRELARERGENCTELEDILRKGVVSVSSLV